MVVIDSDVGDDIDDAYAITWALRSPALDVRAIMVSFGDTALRAQLVRRMLDVLGRSDVVVVRGAPTPSGTVFSQAAWARDGRQGGTASLAFVARLIRRHPNRVTLIALGPLGDVAGLRRLDPAAFGKLGRILAMGRSIRLGYGQTEATVAPKPSAEYNVVQDPAALRDVLASGVPVTLFPLDSTQIKLTSSDEAGLVATSNATTAMLEALTTEWRANNARGQKVPILFDAVPVAAAIDATLCPARPKAIKVDDRGLTRVVEGPANALVCLNVEHRLVISRLIADVDREPYR
ncbi:nucleoside hydrolase [uncultured Sphingomonas sp.]|uniref:nucleoside hydrolase n=1 Tax=uncultured Sphingomonas sp. TaxID=158754 RepID=UPI0035CA7486